MQSYHIAPRFSRRSALNFCGSLTGVLALNSFILTNLLFDPHPKNRIAITIKYTATTAEAIDNYIKIVSNEERDRFRSYWINEKKAEIVSRRANAGSILYSTHIFQSKKDLQEFIWQAGQIIGKAERQVLGIECEYSFSIVNS